MKKITFTTLKSLAKKWELIWRITQEFSWMTDWLELVNNNLKNFTLQDLEKVKMTTNFLTRISETEVKLSNCCYRIIFSI